jgi:hypothetical protein
VESLGQGTWWRVWDRGRGGEFGTGDVVESLGQGTWWRSTQPVLSFGHLIFMYKVKAIPLQAWTGPEGSRRLRLPDLKTIGT